MLADDFWDFVFSDDWSNFSTLRLTSGSVLKDLFVHLEDLTNEGCIESETITHFDDHLSFSQVHANVVYMELQMLLLLLFTFSRIQLLSGIVGLLMIYF